MGLSFDTDNEAPLLRDGNTSATALSAAEYGAASGMPRILADARPAQDPGDVLRHRRGRDAAPGDGGGDPEDRPPRDRRARLDSRVPAAADAEEEERLLDQAIEYLTKVTGKRPVGYRAPSWAFSPVTLDLILKKGFLYDSSLQALDEPYEVMSRGKLTGPGRAARSTGR